MKKLILICSFLIPSFAPFLKAQIDVNWTDRMIYDNKLDGFFISLIGKNSKFVYAKFDNLSLRMNKNSSKAKIVAFDKNSMTKVGETTLIDSKKNPAVAKNYKDLRFYKTIVFENIIYVFWMKEDKLKDELFVQTYDSKLNALQKLKKIYELNSNSKDSKKAEIFVMANQKVNESIVIGGELASSKNNNVTIEYKVLKNDLSFSSANQVELPIVIKGKSNSLTSSYEFGDDGNLHVETYVSLSKEERKMLKKGEASRYPIYSVVELASGHIQSYSMKFDNKNIFDFDVVATKDAIKVFGFFCDLSKDPKGSDTHGVFYAILDPKTFQLNGEMNFTYFTKQQLDELFAKDRDKSDRKDRKLISSKKKKQSEEESLASDYVIEDVQSVDKDNLVLFCSVMGNYTTTSCDSKGNCHTNYYCQKDNVTAFKLDNKGKIVWASNLDRKITYSGWNIYDLKTSYKDGSFFVAYGSDYSINSDKKNRSTKKSRKYKSDRFEYAMFDYVTGKFTKNEYKVNPVNVKKADKKSISVKDIIVFDNELYSSSTIIKMKPLPVVLGCLGALICPPVIMIPFMSGNARKGSGNLAHITITK